MRLPQSCRRAGPHRREEAGEPDAGVPILGERTRGDCRYRTGAEDRQETIRLATVRWHRREPRSRVAAGDGGLNTDGKEERFVLRLLGSGVLQQNRLSHHVFLLTGRLAWCFRRFQLLRAYQL